MQVEDATARQAGTLQHAPLSARYSEFTYRIADVGAIPSPGVVVFRDLLERNLDQMVTMAGGPERLRPHCKTHKTREILPLLLTRGVTRHKAATLREVELCLEVGVRDVLLAYQVVGPSIEQFVGLASRYPDARLAALVDTEAVVDWLAAAARARGVTVGAMVDLDTGFHRTGIAVGDGAARLYERVSGATGLWPAGLHVYDAQNYSHNDPVVRRAAIDRTFVPVLDLYRALVSAGRRVPEILCGGSPTFPSWTAADTSEAPVIHSPGTVVFSDHTYHNRYPDLGAAFRPAALILGRVISRPMAGYATIDVGSKAIAADPPLGQRGAILGLEDAETAVHNEEHWAVRSANADAFRVGDPVLVVPAHICPCVNLHPFLYLIGPDGSVEDRWEVAARHRSLAW